MKKPSQRTMVRVMEVLEGHGGKVNMSRFLYEHEFEDWFVIHAESYYYFDWQRILMALRNTQFFYPSTTYFSSNSILGKPLSRSDAEVLGECLIQRLAALATTFQNGETVARSLEIDGFQVNQEKLSLVPLEGPVSEQEEEDRFAALVRASGLPRAETILKHARDAQTLYIDRKDHPALNESRNFLQALIDDISIETDRHGGHGLGLPGATANRIGYLRQVGFLTADEETAFCSAWGTLSAGSHPGVPAREEARIGLILALEFGQLLLLKFANWRANRYTRLS